MSVMRRYKYLCAFLFCFLLFLRTSSAFAHDFSLTFDWDKIGPSYQYTTVHEDADPFKGWANITVTNTGTEAWGDFHFEIFQVGDETVDNVDFIVDSPYEPTSSQSGLTWDVNNIDVGATLDLYFYSDPVLPTETANFTVYTDNTTDQVSFFGMAMYPTPVPEPATICLLGLGGLALLRKRKA